MRCQQRNCIMIIVTITITVIIERNVFNKMYVHIVYIIHVYSAYMSRINLHACYGVNLIKKLWHTNSIHSNQCSYTRGTQVSSSIIHALRCC